MLSFGTVDDKDLQNFNIVFIFLVLQDRFLDSDEVISLIGLPTVLCHKIII